MRTYLYLRELPQKYITYITLNATIEVISNKNGYETYYGSVPIDTEDGQIYENEGHLLSDLLNRGKIVDKKSKEFLKRLENIENSYPEYFI